MTHKRNLIRSLALLVLGIVALGTAVRADAPGEKKAQWVRQDGKGVYENGLTGKHIALWHSHGFYYEPKLDRWEWQRARCFGNVEDIGNMPYVVGYLTPMLEGAGANVLLPRERDLQPEMVVVDNDGSSAGRSREMKKGKWRKAEGGYGHKAYLYARENPFTMGTHYEAPAEADGRAQVAWVPDLPEGGEYAVYVSWKNVPGNVSDARYRVCHTGGTTEFTVDQRMYGQTWVYLGTFTFDKGRDPGKGAVVLTNRSDEAGGVVTADAVRFGGGMGNVLRRPSARVTENVKSSSRETPRTHTLDPERYSWKGSGVSRYLEGSRYYLQFAGMPDSVYSPTGYRNDYTDDYRDRAHWINYLKGNYAGSLPARGHGVPVDLSLAFHTDAGATPNDSIIGTLAIYSTYHDKFSDGSSKEVSGRYSGLVQNQIVSDVRRLHNTAWTQRDLRNADYSEAALPDVPALLLELLSHQNAADLVYGLDPRFRFTVARAIYKGMLRYLSEAEGRDYVVQPLPVRNIGLEKLDGKRVRLSWDPVSDPLEETAVPEKYRIYVRTGDKGYATDFVEVTGTAYEAELPQWGERYSFKVRPVNKGGEGLASAEVSACLFQGDARPVLIVNGFDRVSGPAFFDCGDKAGVAWWEDEGVPDGTAMEFIGYQHDFDRSSPWLDDDCPGWGASGLEGWGKRIAGNTHDFARKQGAVYQRLGHSYVSADRGAFEKGLYRPGDYKLVDVLFGEQRTVKNFRSEKDSAADGEGGRGTFPVYTPALMKAMKAQSDAGVPLLVSGAYVGTDMVENRDSAAVKFAGEVLHYRWMANHASGDGKVYATDEALPYGVEGAFGYNIRFCPDVYRVESPDAVEPVGPGAVRLMRYAYNNLSAGTLYDGSAGGGKAVVLGFPLETVTDPGRKTELMGRLMGFLTGSVRGSGNRK